MNTNSFNRSGFLTPCERHFLKIRSQNPSANPVFGIYASNLEVAADTYIANMQRGFFVRLKYTTHVLADIDGEFVDQFTHLDKNKFFTEKRIISYLSELYS